jgi:hypothetical protein
MEEGANSLGKRTAAASVISKNNVVADYTRPEVAFDVLFGNRVTKPLPLHVKEERSEWSLSPDRMFIGTGVFVQIDGPYHRTVRQEAKSKWEDELFNQNGFRVLHIDSGLLMVKRHHPHVLKETEAFLRSDEKSRRLPA